MKTVTKFVSTMIAVSSTSLIASADINPGCIETYTDCQEVIITSVADVDPSTCKYNPMAMQPADPAGATQCEYTVSYKCDGKDKTSVVISPARFGCSVKQ